MRDIFSDLYDRVLSFFTNQNEADETKNLAKSRLKTVLMQDRVGFSERAMQMLKDDLIDTISKYLEIDIESFDLSIDAIDESTVLNLSIPVLRTKTDEEIDEAVALAQKEHIEKTQEIVGEIQELVKEKAAELAQDMTEEKADSEEAEESKEVDSCHCELDSESEQVDEAEDSSDNTDETLKQVQDDDGAQGDDSTQDDNVQSDSEDNNTQPKKKKKKYKK